MTCDQRRRHISIGETQEHLYRAEALPRFICERGPNGPIVRACARLVVRLEFVMCLLGYSGAALVDGVTTLARSDEFRRSVIAIGGCMGAALVLGAPAFLAILLNSLSCMLFYFVYVLLGIMYLGHKELNKRAARSMLEESLSDIDVKDEV
jgi:hypothetical protein